MTVGSDKDLAGLRKAGRVVALALKEMREALEPGMTTGELDGIGAEVLEKNGARSAPGVRRPGGARRRGRRPREDRRDRRAGRLRGGRRHHGGRPAGLAAS